MSNVKKELIKIIQLDTKAMVPFYQQIKDSIIQAIDSGKVKPGDKIPSINQICKEFKLAPGTVSRAYEEMRNTGLIASKQGKGYYISSSKTNTSYKVFLLFDRLNSYKEILYHSFMEAMGENATVDIYFHHYNVKRFKQLIDDNIGQYSYYVVMPHFNTDVSEIVAKIPIDKLIIIDKEIPEITGNYSSVCQNFHEDIFNAMTDAKTLLEKYTQVNLVVARKNKFQFIPSGIISGFEQFCKQYKYSYKIIENLTPESIVPNQSYITFTETDLILFLKESITRGFITGDNIGLISYDDTPVKEIIAGGISVFSTDFVFMGQKVASLIQNGGKEKVFCPFKFIKRNTV